MNFELPTKMYIHDFTVDVDGEEAEPTVKTDANSNKTHTRIMMVKMVYE